MRTEAPALLPIFRSRRQADLLSWLFLRPHDEPTMTELADHLRASPSSIHGEVERLVLAGLLTRRSVGRSRVVRANTNARIARPLTELLMLTFGPHVVVAEEFRDLEGLAEVVIFGSWARRYQGELGREPADIDVLVIGTPDRDGVYNAATRAERRLGIQVNPVVRSSDAWAAVADPLVATAREHHVVVIGEDAL